MVVKWNTSVKKVIALPLIVVAALVCMTSVVARVVYAVATLAIAGLVVAAFQGKLRGLQVKSPGIKRRFAHKENPFDERWMKDLPYEKSLLDIEKSLAQRTGLFTKSRYHRPFSQSRPQSRKSMPF